MSINVKIGERLDLLQKMLENNDHINNQSEALEMISNISKFWSVLSEEDRDYIQAAQHAIDEQQTWDI